MKIICSVFAARVWELSLVNFDVGTVRYGVKLESVSTDLDVVLLTESHLHRLRSTIILQEVMSCQMFLSFGKERTRVRSLKNVEQKVILS